MSLKFNRSESTFHFLQVIFKLNNDKEVKSSNILNAFGTMLQRN